MRNLLGWFIVGSIALIGAVMEFLFFGGMALEQAGLLP
jgi:hypothetical protein